MSLKYTCALFTIKWKSKLSMCMKHTLLSHKQKYTHVEVERNIPTAILPQSLPNLTPKGFFSRNKTNRGNTMETGHISGPRPFSQYDKDWWHEQSIVNCSDSVRIELSEKLILSKIWNGYWKLKKYLSENWIKILLIDENSSSVLLQLPKYIKRIPVEHSANH